MDNQHKLTSKHQVILVAPFLSLEKAKDALDCSRSFIYKLIDEGILKPHYLKSKPYFMIEDLLNAMEQKDVHQ